MAFNISQFNAQIGKYGLARDNLFLVKITPPRSLDQSMPMRDLSFFCNAVTLPSLNLQLADIQRHGYGTIEKRPTNLPFDQLNTTFMVDSTFRVKEFFHQWLQSVVNFDNSQGHNYQHRNMLPYEFGYHEKYVGTVEVAVYSFNSEEITYIYHFGNAFPVSLGDIQEAWAQNNSFMVMPVQFAYDIYKVQGFGQSIKSSRVNPSRGFGGGGTEDYITRISNFGKALDAFGVNTPIQDIVNQFSTVANQFNSILR